MRPSLPRRFALALVWVLAPACAGSSDAAFGGVTSDTVTAEPLATIGTFDGPPEYLLGHVESVVVDRAGTVYVADGLGSSVRAYDTAGRYLGMVGTEGDGPGEFRSRFELVLDPDDRLLVWDRARLTLLDRSGGSPFADSVARTIPFGASQAQFTRSRIFGGRLYAASYYYYMFVNHRYFYVVVDSTGPTGDTIAVPSIPDPTVFGRTNYPVAGGGLPVEGVSLAPFEAAPRWAIADSGHVLVSPGDRYEIVAWDAAEDTVRVIRHPTVPRPVDPAVARDSARAFDARLDSIPVALDEVRGMSSAARTRTLGEVLPEVLALQVDREGNIWVRRWPESSSETLFDVLDASGEPLLTVRVPAPLVPRPLPWVSTELVVGVVEDPDTGIQRIAVFGLPGA